jgi:hypothetical protein
MISESQFEVIQARMDRMVIPTGIGHIPYKIRSGFSLRISGGWGSLVRLELLDALGKRMDHFMFAWLDHR